MVEKTTGRHIKVVRSDKGGEYTSTTFMEYCEEQGIGRFLTASYTLQQNGVAEKKPDHSRHGLVNAQEQKDAKEILGRSRAMRYLCAESMSTCKVR